MKVNFETRISVASTTHPHLGPRVRKSRTIPLLPLWAFMACSRARFTFTLPFDTRIMFQFGRCFNVGIVFGHSCSIVSRDDSSCRLSVCHLLTNVVTIQFHSFRFLAAKGIQLVNDWTAECFFVHV
jgi:hypothetical protein